MSGNLGRRFLPAVLLLVPGSFVSAADPLPKVELSKRGKAATALVELRPRTAYAGAFCVHPSGLFVTTEQPLRQGGDGDTVTMILRPGLKTQQVSKAKVVRRDAERNLALLRVEGVRDLPALPLGADDDLAELLELAAFGFPKEADLGEGEYPSLSVKLGHVSSLRRKAGDLTRVETDITLAPGFSGGAALDPQGKVAGVVVAGTAGAAAHVIPAGQVSQFLSRPDVQFTPPAVTAANRGVEHLFEVRVVSVLPDTQPRQVELILRGDDGKDRRHTLEQADGVYRVKAVPAPGEKKVVRLPVSVTFADGAAGGTVADQEIKVAGKAVKLSEVRSIRFGPKGAVVLHDGKTLDGAPAGLDGLEVVIDEAPVRLKLAEAVEARFDRPPEAEAVAYTVVVRQEGKEVARLTGRLGGDGAGPAAPPSAGVTGIRPPALDQEQVVKMLPGTVADVCVGGGGRYLIFYLPQHRKLAVFDVNAAQVVKYLPAAEDGVKLAAGRDKLVVVLPTAKLIQRWSLTSFEREVTVPLPVQYPLTSIAMGSASDGPLAVQAAAYPAAGEMFFFDIKTMKKLDMTNGQKVHTNVGPQFRLHAAPNGSVFTAGNQSYILRGAVFDSYQAPANGELLPGPDGRTLYWSGQMFTAEAKPLGQQASGHGHAVWYVPALHGPYYLSVNETHEAPNRPVFLSPRVHLQGDSRPLVTLPKLDALEGLVDWGRGQPQPLDQHVFLIPDAQLLALVPATKDRLILRRFNLDQLLDQSGVDYLFVTSQPPTEYRPGSTLSYQLAARSRKGGLRYKLESGPAGMAVSPSGLLRWSVPGNFDQPTVDAIITVSDASGQEIFHTFRLTNAERAAVAANPANPANPVPVAPQVPPAPPAAPGQTLVRPPANPLPITAAPLKSDRLTLPLPASARDVCVGGGGRFLILHLPQPRQLAVFDVNEARVVKYLPVPEDNVFIAAGMDKLLVVLPDRNLVQRWSLTTFEREVTVPLPATDRINGAVMGSASDGPLVLSGGRVQFVDVRALKEITPEGNAIGATHPQYPPTLRISADGRVLGMWTPGLSPSGLQAVVLSGRSVERRYEHTSVGHILPSPDGRYLLTGSGLYTAELKRVDGGTPGRASGYLVPAVHGNYYLSVANAGGVPGRNAAQSSAGVYMIGDTRPLLTLTDLEGLGGAEFPGRPAVGTLPLEKRLFLIPLGRLIVTLPTTADKLFLYRFDLDDALNNSGIDYLLVTSQPQTTAVKGKSYAYALAVKSKKGGVRYKLESGPDGMKISPDGRLSWDVPASFGEAEVTVIVTVSDASGQEIFHTFRIAVKGKE